MASASENTSRPQPFSCDSGVRKNPSADRGPKESMEMAQPHTMMATGVRQVRDEGVACAEDIGGNFDRKLQGKRKIGACARNPKRKFSRRPPFLRMAAIRPPREARSHVGA